jgi:hypothetical protein
MTPTTTKTLASRAKTIYLKGLETYKGSKATGDLRMLQATAVMIAEATKPKTRKKKAKDEPTLPFTPRELYELCVERVPHIVACEPYDSGWFGRLGSSLQRIKGLERDDMENLVEWIEVGNLDFGDNWSFGHIVKHIGNWIPRARATMSGGSAFTGEI